MSDTADDRNFLGHPRGLAVLAGTELWDRISFHGMQSLLVLYMVGQLLLPGHVEHIVGFAVFRHTVEGVTGRLSTQALASQIFGIYIFFVTMTPLIGALIGDRWLGRRPTVVLGALLMTAGHFSMAFDQSFLLAMALIVLGAGCLRGNLSPEVGELYSANDERRQAAFQIYSSAVNLGAFIAPLLTGALGKAYGWHFGFGFAGFGMLLGLIVYLAGQKTLPTPALRKPRAMRRALTDPERKMALFLVSLPPITAMFWVAQSQIWNTYNIWARDHVQLRIGHWSMPVPWLQSLDGLAPFVLLPPLLIFWNWQSTRGKAPQELTKAAIGCLIFAASTLLLACAPLVADAQGKTPLLWVVGFHITSNLGWLFFAPTITALFSRHAPMPINATMMGISLMAVSLGSLISGRLGGFYEVMAPGQFWAIHAGIVGLGGMLLLIMGAIMRRRFPADVA